MKQELLLPMEPKEEEAVSTLNRVSLCLDYEPVINDDHVIHHGDQKEKLLTTNSIVSSTNKDLVTRDFLLEVTNANNNNAMVMAASFNITVSTELELYCDPWKIKKKLTLSDLNGSSRLLIHTGSVKKHVFPFMCVDDVKQVDSGDGLRVCVWDHDTDSTHQLVFKKWSSSKAYIFSLKWKSDFVNRRGLKLGDQVGLYWNCYLSRFGFRVLYRIEN